jgi:hypothetical protein
MEEKFERKYKKNREGEKVLYLIFLSQLGFQAKAL